MSRARLSAEASDIAQRHPRESGSQRPAAGQDGQQEATKLKSLGTDVERVSRPPDPELGRLRLLKSSLILSLR